MVCVTVSGTAKVDDQTMSDCKIVAVLKNVLNWLTIEVTVVRTTGCEV